jgi:hypothetical protein
MWKSFRKYFGLPEATISVNGSQQKAIDQTVTDLSLLDRQCEEGLERVNTGFARLETLQRAETEKMASVFPVIRQMISNKATLLASFSDKSPEIRKWALVVEDLYDHKIEPNVLFPILEQLAFRDANDEVRCIALFTFAFYATTFNHSDEKEIGKRYSDIALSTSEPPAIRIAAYQVLCRFSWEHDPLRWEKAFEECEFPDGIDWEYVRAWQ